MGAVPEIVTLPAVAGEQQDLPLPAQLRQGVQHPGEEGKLLMSVGHAVRVVRVGGGEVGEDALRLQPRQAAGLTDALHAAVKVTAGLSCLSAWICASAFYYMILSVAKALVLLKGRKNAPDETESEKQYREWKVYGLSGLMLSLTTLTLQGVIILIVKDGSVFAYGGTLIFAVASYDFYRLIYSTVYMIKMRRRHTPIVVSAKTISFSASLTAMLTLQAAMFTTFSDMDIRLQKMMNIITGTFVCAILITCGTTMIRRARKELKILWEEAE